MGKTKQSDMANKACCITGRQWYMGPVGTTTTTTATTTTTTSTTTTSTTTTTTTKSFLLSQMYNLSSSITTGKARTPSTVYKLSTRWCPLSN